MHDTFTRLCAFSYRWARGELSNGLTAAVAGFIPDAVADCARQVLRMLTPAPGSMPDAFPFMFRNAGLPPYMPGVVPYAQQLLRLQGWLDTQSRAGSVDQLLEECVRIGIVSPQIEATDRGFWITVPSGATVPCPVIGDLWTIGDGVFLGQSLTPAITHSVAQLADYFKPAADIFEGIKARP